jgi:hypothetical protein
MIRSSTKKVLPLENMEQGHRYALVITKAASNVSLMFRHAGETAYHAFPGFTGTPDADDTVYAGFFCFTSDMYVEFADDPEEVEEGAEAVPYYLSCICAAAATF